MSCGNGKGKCLETTNSSCVIWDGPDIKCLGLCKGDTVTDVVYKAGKTLCELLNKFNISLLDFECYVDENPKPQDIQELLQWFIRKLCELKEEIDSKDLNIDCNYVKNNIYSCNINFSLCDVRGNRQNYILPLYSETGTSFISLLSDIICVIRGNINDIRQDIVNINTQINYILNNCCNEGEGGGLSISIIPNRCVYPFRPGDPPPPASITNMQQLDDYLDNIAQLTCCITNLLGYNANIESCTLSNCGPFNYINTQVRYQFCSPADPIYIGVNNSSLTVNLCNYQSLVGAVNLLYSVIFSTFLNNGVTGIIEYLYLMSTNIQECLDRINTELNDCDCKCTRLSNPYIYAYPLTNASNSFNGKRYKFNVTPATGSYTFSIISLVTGQVVTNDDAGNTIPSSVSYNNVANEISISISQLNNNPFKPTSTQYSDYIYHNVVVKVDYSNDRETILCTKYNNVVIEDKYYTCGPVIELGAYTLEPIS
jgi:hypothetical protein